MLQALFFRRIPNSTCCSAEIAGSVISIDLIENIVFHHTASNLDDLMRAVFARLLSGSRGNTKVNSRKGYSTETFGALLELTDPRARLSRSKSRSRVFSALGECLWYLSGSNALEQIQYYIDGYHEFSDDKKTLNGAYGARIFSAGRGRSPEKSKDQWQRIIETLRESEGSRNAIIQIYANEDGEKGARTFLAPARSISWCERSSYTSMFTCAQMMLSWVFRTTYSHSR